MSDVLYVRNTRPNAVLIRVGGIKYTAERRGSREDSLALPGDWRNDPIVATFLQQGVIEEISKETFMTLGSRPDGVTEIPLKERKAATEVNIPINNPEESRQPYLITEEDLRKSTPLRSPRPEFATEVPTTQEDLLKIEEARKAAEINPGQVDFPESETEQLKLQVNELSALVRELLAKQESSAGGSLEAKPARKVSTKKSTGTRGRPRKPTTKE